VERIRLSLSDCPDSFFFTHMPSTQKFIFPPSPAPSLPPSPGQHLRQLRVRRAGRGSNVRRPPHPRRLPPPRLPPPRHAGLDELSGLGDVCGALGLCLSVVSFLAAAFLQRPADVSEGREEGREGGRDGKERRSEVRAGLIAFVWLNRIQKIDSIISFYSPLFPLPPFH